jgi:NTE family protein
MITVNGQQLKIGLALSGGGFRASIFHMGVFRRLSELNILDKIDVISVVSGGAIVGAYYVIKQNNWDDIASIEEGFKKGLQANIRLRGLTGSPIFHPLLALRSLLPGFTRTNIVAKEYRKYFFGDTTLEELPETPKLIINAASLNTGKVWKFTREGMGDWKFGFSLAPNFLLADAVGASSAVPGIFAPLTLNKTYLEKIQTNDEYKHHKRVNLVDGGVRDNQGLTSILSEKCDYVICSDASGLLTDFQKPPESTFPVLFRSYNITMDASRAWAIRLLYQKKAEGEIKEMAFFDLKDKVPPDTPGLPYDLEPNPSDPDLVHLVANIRTDLDYFSDDEIFALMYHGYTLLNHTIKKYASDLLQGQDIPLKWTEAFSEQRIKQLKHSFRNSSKSRFRPFKAG